MGVATAVAIVALIAVGVGRSDEPGRAGVGILGSASGSTGKTSDIPGPLVPGATPDASPHDRPVLGYGSVGADVAVLQARLAELGFDPGAIDGRFGADTAAAVKAFQTSTGIRADGIVGPQTWAGLDGQP